MPRQQPSRVPLGQAVRRLREDRNLTIEGLAAASDTHWTYLSEIERGLANPTWDKLADIATALDVPLSELVQVAEAIDRGETSVS
jgi:transcriptional regulator with XRE-family HTH domain